MDRERITVAVYDEATGWSLPVGMIDGIRAAAGEGVEVIQARGQGELLRALPETTQLIGFPLTAQQFTSTGERVAWVQLVGTVTDASSLAPAVENGLRVTTAESFRAPHVAEHAVAMALTMLRCLNRAVTAQAEHRWAAAEIASSIRSLSSLTVGVVSLGTTGHAVAERFKALGARTIITSPHASHASDAASLVADEVMPLADVRSLAARCDVLTIAAPRTPATARLIDRQTLQRMKADAIIVDVSRGGILEPAALLDALRRRRLGGAALDGFETRPLPASSPLWTMPNVLISPSLAAASDRYWDDATRVIVENVRRYNAGEPLVDELDPTLFQPATRSKR